MKLADESSHFVLIPSWTRLFLLIFSCMQMVLMMLDVFWSTGTAPTILMTQSSISLAPRGRTDVPGLITSSNVDLEEVDDVPLQPPWLPPWPWSGSLSLAFILDIIDELLDESYSTLSAIVRDGQLVHKLLHGQFIDYQTYWSLYSIIYTGCPSISTPSSERTQSKCLWKMQLCLSEVDWKLARGANPNSEQPSSLTNQSTCVTDQRLCGRED